MQLLFATHFAVVDFANRKRERKRSIFRESMDIINSCVFFIRSKIAHLFQIGFNKFDIEITEFRSLRVTFIFVFI